MTKIINTFVFFLYIFLFSSCGELMTRRSFVTEMDKETDGFFMAGRDFAYSAGDTGKRYRTRREVSERTPASKNQRKRRRWLSSLTDELKGREGSLSEDELSDYDKKKRYLGNDSEKIYYLQLKKNERQEYLNSKRAGTDEVLSDNNNSLLGLVSDHKRGSTQIFLGMNKSSVERTWGSPSRVDIAGNPHNQNERWTFYDGNKIRKVFFENGVVGGWTTE